MSTQTTSPFLVQVAKDRMSATIMVGGNVELGEVTPNEVVTALEAAKVVVDDTVTQRVTEYVEALRDPEQDHHEGFVIAKGRPCTEGADGTFTWEDSFNKQAAAWSEDGPINYYDVSSITTVEQGALIGWITPTKTGSSGQDVHGAELRPKQQPREITLKQGIKLGEDGKSVTATIAGRVVFQNFELYVNEVVIISGNVDFETGNLDISIDVMIRGTVRDLFHVKSKKNIAVEGSIEAAEIDADGDVTVRGGILNRHKGKVVVGGEITAKFCDEANLRAQGDIRVVKQVMNSQIHTEGKLLVHQGAVIGGESFARGGVEVATLGSDADVPTSIAVGVHPDELRKIEGWDKENEKRRASVEKIRRAVVPLMAQLKRLTGAQREKATELMYQADEIEAEIKKTEEEATAILAGESDENQPYVLVSSRIHQRVSVSIGDRVVTFHEEFKDPVKIERRKIRNHTVVVAVNQLTGSVHELPARKIERHSEKDPNAN